MFLKTLINFFMELRMWSYIIISVKFSRWLPCTLNGFVEETGTSAWYHAFPASPFNVQISCSLLSLVSAMLNCQSSNTISKHVCPKSHTYWCIGTYMEILLINLILKLFTFLYETPIFTCWFKFYTG